MEIDFSGLSERDGDFPDRITQAEILSVLDNPRYRLFPLEGYPLMGFYTIACGYSSKKKDPADCFEY